MTGRVAVQEGRTHLEGREWKKQKQKQKSRFRDNRPNNSQGKTSVTDTKTCTKGKRKYVPNSVESHARSASPCLRLAVLRCVRFDFSLLCCARPDRHPARHPARWEVPHLSSEALDHRRKCEKWTLGAPSAQQRRLPVRILSPWIWNLGTELLILPNATCYDCAFEDGLRRVLFITFEFELNTSQRLTIALGRLPPTARQLKLMHYTPSWQNLSDQRCRFKLRERCLRDRPTFTGSLVQTFFLRWHNHGLAIRCPPQSQSWRATLGCDVMGGCATSISAATVQSCHVSLEYPNLAEHMNSEPGWRRFWR